MSELFDKSIRTLELPRVLQLLSEQAVSPEAKELALAVRPETDYEDVLRLLDQTDGARAMIVLPGGPGRQPQHPGADPDRRSAVRCPPGQGVFQCRRGRAYRSRPDFSVHPRQPVLGG